MSEKLEQVARALTEVDDSLWVGEDRMRYYRTAARVAIEAMREPTEAMLIAGHGANLCENAPEVWEAMIDEALK